MRLLIYCLLAMAWPVGNVIAQTATTNIRPLTVGDTLPPDLVIENVTNYPVSKIRLSELKGKLVILDFWGKYCTPCILSLQKLDSLQRASNGKIQVISVSDFKDTADLYKTLRRFKPTRDLRLPVILGNGQLSEYFPYTMVSHLVWIDGAGIVKAITGGEYITSKNMSDFLAGNPINWPIKKDIIDFDYKQPLLEYVQSKQGRPISFYYSSLTTHIEGISAPLGTYIDSAREIAITHFYNQPLLNLVQLALDYRIGAKREQFTLNVKDTTRYIRTKDLFNSEWEKVNTYSYYAQLPIGLSEKEVQLFLRADILRWLNVMGIHAEKRRRYVKNKVETQYIITERTKTFI